MLYYKIYKISRIINNDKSRIIIGINLFHPPGAGFYPCQTSPAWIGICFESPPLKIYLETFQFFELCLFSLSQWSEKPCVPHLLQRDTYYVYSQQELKEKLYQEIISFFDRGKVSVSPCSCSRSCLGKFPLAWIQSFLAGEFLAQCLELAEVG